MSFRDIHCKLGFHKWKSMGKMIPAIGNHYYELFECENPKCFAHKNVKDGEITHYNWIGD